MTNLKMLTILSVISISILSCSSDDDNTTKSDNCDYIVVGKGFNGAVTKENSKGETIEVTCVTSDCSFDVTVVPSVYYDPIADKFDDEIPEDVYRGFQVSKETVIFYDNDDNTNCWDSSLSLDGNVKK